MKSFDTLTQRGQIRRLRNLAIEALKQYPIKVAKISRLKYYNNITFQIDATNGSRYVLRINRPGFQDANAIHTEAQWLMALQNDLGMIVPDPVPNQKGDLVTTASTSGVPEPRHGILFRWVYGRFLHAKLTPTIMSRVGQTLAQIHTHGQNYVSVNTFSRKHWDHIRLLHQEAGTNPNAVYTLMTKKERTLFDKARNQAEEQILALNKTPNTYGLIHGDLHPRNFLVLNQEICPIDFDECGWGYYMYDITVALSELRRRPDYPQMWAAFFEGYRTIRPIPKSQEDLFPTFLIARIIMLVRWQAGIPDPPWLKAGVEEFVQIALKRCRGYLSGEMF